MGEHGDQFEHRKNGNCNNNCNNDGNSNGDANGESGSDFAVYSDLLSISNVLTLKRLARCLLDTLDGQPYIKRFVALHLALACCADELASKGEKSHFKLLRSCVADMEALVDDLERAYGS